MRLSQPLEICGHTSGEGTDYNFRRTLGQGCKWKPGPLLQGGTDYCAQVLLRGWVWGTQAVLCFLSNSLSLRINFQLPQQQITTNVMT